MAISSSPQLNNLLLAAERIAENKLEHIELTTLPSPSIQASQLSLHTKFPFQV